MNKTNIVKKITAVVKGRQFVLAAIVALVSVLSVAAVLTPNHGILTNYVPVRGSFVDPTDLKFTVNGHSNEVVNVNNARQTVFQQVVIAPGGYTGWHTHPGPVIVLVKSGQLSFYAGDDPTCTARTYSAGQAFIDKGQGSVHIGRNEGSENLELWSAYLDVPPGEAFRIDTPAPGNCHF